jgi:hypothetical protein
MSADPLSAGAATWLSANQALLVAEFVRIKHLLGGNAADTVAIERARASLTTPSAIDHICELFGMTDFERDTLLLCAGVEMDSGVATLCGEALGHGQRSQATFGLAMAIFPDAEWGALLPTRPLRAFRLIEVAATGQGLTSAPLRIDERVLHYLAGLDAADTRLTVWVQEPNASHRIAPSHLQIASGSVPLLNSGARQGLVLHLCGDDPQGQEDVASALAGRLDHRLFVARSGELPAVGADLDQFASLWARDARLLRALLLVQCNPTGITPAARQLVERIQGPVCVASRESLRFDRPFIRSEVDKPSPSEQKQLWDTALGSGAADLDSTLDELSEQFRLSARTIAAAGQLVSSGGAPPAQDALWNTCKTLCRPKLEDLAQRMVGGATWEDLVLPDTQQRTLKQLTTQVRHRMTVYETWGFSAKRPARSRRERPVHGRERDGQDAGRGSASRTNCAWTCTASTCRPSSASTSGKPKRI